MGKLIINGVDGQLGGHIAEFVLEKTKDFGNLIFTGYNMEKLDKYKKMGIEIRKVDYNDTENLPKAFEGAETMVLVSMPFIGEPRRNAHKNAVDAAKIVGIKRIIYTSYSGAGDPSNQALVLEDHNFTEDYIKESGLKYRFVRDSNYAEAILDTVMDSNFETGKWISNQGFGRVAYIAREDCAKAIAAVAMGAGEDNHAYTVCGTELLTCSDCMAIATEVIGKKFEFISVSDDELFAQFDSMGIPRTTEDMKNSPWPWCSEDMVSCGAAVRNKKMEIMTDDYQYLVGEKPMSLKQLFQRKYNK